MKFEFPGVPGQGYRLTFTGKPAKTDKGALINSIKKWEFIAEWIEEHKRVPYSLSGIRTCNLCILHYASHCLGCPIQEYTGRTECRGTPNELFEELTGDENNQWKKALSLSKKEINLLKKIYVKEYGREPKA